MRRSLSPLTTSCKIFVTWFLKVWCEWYSSDLALPEVRERQIQERVVNIEAPEAKIWGKKLNQAQLLPQCDMMSFSKVLDWPITYMQMHGLLC